MTPAETAVETAISFKGNTRRKCCEIYNSFLPHPRGYKVKQEDYLCATYVSAVFIELGWTDIVPPECGAHQLYNNMDALGRAVLDRKFAPKVGDLIFFGGATSSSIGHVGIVTEMRGKQIYYYDMQGEGVYRHTCPVGYKTIAGYAFPDYASKGDSAEPSKEERKDFRVGDLVTINPGAKWYKGESIKLSCISDKWYIISLKGDRAVLGMNKAETRNIQSPIHTSDITLVTASKPMQSKVTVSVTIDWDTMQLLEIMATGNNKTIGECIDLLLEDAR